ncbi:TIM44-like domain-containing protein [Mesorhizobium sp. NFR06]|uniref:TIM44-like domain-containing protein n=1 Tax=Mesorhizobium sp. NFR06 TaxID=1566290 RepID=UPI001FCF0EA3|nr:TIM44-like domain-containing protein [Mesorhizobium sp. NFR06]
MESGALDAYESIVKAYVAGDLTPVQRFVGPAALDVFQRAIAERRQRQETLELTCVSIKDPVMAAGPGKTVELELTPKAARERFDALQEEVEREIGYRVYVQNDITAAAGGESMFGVAKHLSDYLFFYLGARLHSRLVLNHQIYNTTAAVSFDVGILRLEEEIRKKGNSPSDLWERGADWPSFGDAEIAWQRDLVEQMKSSIAALKPFVPVASVVLSSYAPQAICRAICRELEQAMPGTTAIAGNIERLPKAVGAASLPFSSRFMVE